MSIYSAERARVCGLRQNVGISPSRSATLQNGLYTAASVSPKCVISLLHKLEGVGRPISPSGPTHSKCYTHSGSYLVQIKGQDLQLRVEIRRETALNKGYNLA